MQNKTKLCGIGAALLISSILTACSEQASRPNTSTPTVLSNDEPKGASSTSELLYDFIATLNAAIDSSEDI